MPHEILKPVFERSDQRGVFQELLNTGTWESVIFTRMHPGATLGNHYHKKTDLFVYLLRGAAEIRTVDVESGEQDRFMLESGSGVILQSFQSHAIRFVQESEAIILKSCRFDKADPDTYPFPLED